MRYAFTPRSLALLLTLGLIWGTSFMFISLGLGSFSPLLFAAVRFAISALAIFALAAARRQGGLMPVGRTQWLTVLLAAAFNIAGYHGLLFWGQQHTTAGIAGVIVGLNPVITTVFSRTLLPDDRVGPAGLFGLALGLGGVAVLAGLKPGALLDARGVGELAIAAAIISWALGSVLIKRAEHGMDAYAFVAWQAGLGAALLYASSGLLEGGGRVVWDGPGLLSLLYLALLASGVGFVLYFTLLEWVGPIRVNLVSHVAAVFATLSGWLVLGDPVELRALLSFALIAGGFALVARPARERTVVEPAAPGAP